MVKLNIDELSQESLEGLTLRGKLCNEKIFLLKEAGINSKIFHFWKSKGLVDFIVRGQWSRFTFVEYLWLRVLETLRKFGCSVKQMKELYDYFFTRAYHDNLAEKNFASQYEHYSKLSKLRTLTKDESEILEAIENIKKYPALQMISKNEASYFHELVLDCLKYKTEAGIIIFEDGTFSKYLLSPFEEKKETDTVFDVTKPHINIPVSGYIREFIADENKDGFLIKTGLLSVDEYRVIREIRNKNVKYIKIKFRESEHAIEKIECDKKGLIKGEDAKKIMNLLSLKNYTGIELNTRDGNTISFTHTEKKFF